MITLILKLIGIIYLLALGIALATNKVNKIESNIRSLGILEQGLKPINKDSSIWNMSYKDPVYGTRYVTIDYGRKTLFTFLFRKPKSITYSK